MLSMSFISLLLLGLGALAQARVQFLGVAIAGGDFGCQIDGTCPLSNAQLPLSSLGGADGQGQMKHFVQNDGLNIFRLTTSWQFLVNSNSNPSGTLDATNAGKYDQLVQACLATGAYCMLDLHNFARFNGGIIGQGGPADDVFVSLWSALATKYASQPKIVFEVMNEPHDLDVPTWAQTVQKVVTAIRGAGANSQMILLPGTNFDSAATLVSSGSADALLAITNPDGSTTNLILDIHKYLDNDNSGTHAQCTTDNVGNFTIVANYLRSKGRQGLVSETGASSQSSCLTDFCTQNAFINANADVFLGYVGWAAGGFDTSYVLSLTPSKQGNNFIDNTLFTQCVLGPYLNSSQTVPSGPSPPPPGSSATATTTATATPGTSTLATGPAATGTAGSPSTTTAKGGKANRTTSVSGTGAATSTSTGAQTVQTVNAASGLKVAKNVLLGVAVGAVLL